MKKQGLILNLPTDIDLNWSQGPQVIVFADFLRVYFSTRRLEGSYYYSDVAYVDYDLEFRQPLNFSSHQIIEKGVLGSFDSDGIFPFHVFKPKRNDERLVGFICGWKRKVSVDIDMSVGISESYDNGYTFHRIGNGPVMSPNLCEPFLIGDPFVLQEKDQYIMFYIRGRDWLKNKNGGLERRYSISMADSPDLLNWNRNSRLIIPERLRTEAQAMPSVLFLDGVYHLMYCYRDVFDFRDNSLNSYKIGHAFSNDLQNWRLSSFKVPAGNPGEWDSEMQCYPNIFESNGKVFLLYNGNNFGRHGIGLVELTREELASYAQF